MYKIHTSKCQVKLWEQHAQLPRLYILTKDTICYFTCFFALRATLCAKSTPEKIQQRQELRLPKLCAPYTAASWGYKLCCWRSQYAVASFTWLFLLNSVVYSSARGGVCVFVKGELETALKRDTKCRNSSYGIKRTVCSWLFLKCPHYDHHMQMLWLLNLVMLKLLQW